MSSTFVDGPAAGREISHRRYPRFLRVVVDVDGTVDVLDLLEDEPRASEAVFVYEMDGRPVGWLLILSARYRHLADVDGEALRGTQAWRDWVQARTPEGRIDPRTGALERTAS